MLFDGPADLPTATLRSRASEARHRVLAADLHGWLASRWRWVRPRTVPLLVAFAWMLAIPGATKYLSVYAYNDDLRLRAPASIPNFGGDVASTNPALPKLSAPQPSPGADGNAVGTPIPGRRGGKCGTPYLAHHAKLRAEPRSFGSPDELTPDRPAPSR